MISNSIVVAVLALSVLALQQVLCQNVDLRAASDKSSVEGQSRTIFGQRYPSPHRTMHFGKRVEDIQPQLIFPGSSGVYDLLEPGRLPLQPIFHSPDRKDSYLFAIELGPRQTLKAIPEGQEQVARNILYTVDPQVGLEYVLADRQPNKLAQQQILGPFDKTRFMRLMKSDDTSDGGASGNDASSNSNEQQEGGNENVSPQDAQGQQAAISVSSRSVPMTRMNSLNFPKTYISTLLYGRQEPAMQGGFGFNKKAEPKNNLFMHFGRK